MAHLESMLRRLLASTLHRLDDVEHAPAGPGVFLLSDSDQTTSYYIESCQTLRVGLGNVLRGGRSAKSNRGPSAGRGYSESGLKSKLAEHLGINETKVNQYMKDHCVVRWIQLDDEAAHLAHFAIGVLRTPLTWIAQQRCAVLVLAALSYYPGQYRPLFGAPIGCLKSPFSPPIPPFR